MNVVAVIVTYQPELDQLRQSISVLRPQVDALVLVDNESRQSLREGLRGIADEHECKLQENASNFGIAAALNQGVEVARSLNASFVLFFDQDSIVSRDFVAQELSCYAFSAAGRRIGLVSPQIINRVTGVRSSPICGPMGEPLLAQTSGAMMPIDVFQDVGVFAENLFIDYVDYEHCLRMCLKGWQIAYAELATLNHLPGKNLRVSRFGQTKYIANEAPSRHYYGVRNCVWLAIRYFRAYPLLVCKLFWSLGRERIKVLLFEENRAAKMKAWMRGLKDALRNQMGARF